MRALMAAETPVVTLVGKSSDLHVNKVLETTLEDNLAMIFDTVAYFKRNGRTVFYDAEHFFDGFRVNRRLHASDHSQRCGGRRRLPGAVRHQRRRPHRGAGGDCRTRAQRASHAAGHPLPQRRRRGRRQLARRRHGGRDVQVQGTINGYGERCGNANLLSDHRQPQGEDGHRLRYKCDSWRGWRRQSHFVSEIVNIPPNGQQPYVGASAFSHKGGLHAAAVAKIEESYQHISPERVGNANRVVISELSGRGNIQMRLRELGLADRVSREQVADHPGAAEGA